MTFRQNICFHLQRYKILFIRKSFFHFFTTKKRNQHRPGDCRHCPFYKPSPIARLRHIFQNHEKNCMGNCPYVDRVIDKIEGFRLEKKFKNGGVLYIHDDVERKKGKPASSIKKEPFTKTTEKPKFLRDATCLGTC